MTSTPKIINLLSEGRENAKTAKELVNLLDYRSTREISKEINSLRNAGWVILSTTENDNPGYYLPSEKSEVQHFVRAMRSRVREIEKAVASAENELDKWDDDDE